MPGHGLGELRMYVRTYYNIYVRTYCLGMALANYVRTYVRILIYNIQLARARPYDLARLGLTPLTRPFSLGGFPGFANHIKAAQDELWSEFCQDVE